MMQPKDSAPNQRRHEMHKRLPLASAMPAGLYSGFKGGVRNP